MGALALDELTWPEVANGRDTLVLALGATIVERVRPR